MDSLGVTLIVKAPNQQIEDQQVKCELSWSINKLKQHLSEVYPSKPPKNEQKLIYSGQLLNDSVILKDVLRQYEGQDTHTMHLVCSPRHSAIRKQQPPPRQQPQQAEPANSSDTQPNRTNQQNNVPTDQRVPNLYPTAQQMNMNWIRPENAEQFALHMQMMQQAYFQYMTQYMNMNNPTNIYQPIPGQQQAFIPPQNPVQPEAEDVQPAPQAQQPPRDENLNRDWLDFFYLLSRVMIFISIVYFYSSPARFLCVVLLGVGMYLYQIGFFRNANINNNNIVQGERGAEDEAPSRFLIAWTFLTTFFTSLIPEIPNVV